MNEKLIWMFFGLLTHLSVFGQTGVIEGQVYNRIEKKGLDYAVVWLVDTKKGLITDSNGNFKIDSVPNGIYDLQVSSIIGDTIVKGLVITTGTSLKMKLELPPYCKYEKHQNNKTCPICNKEDRVIPIIYGLPIGKMDNRHYYYAGCEITLCNPTWYCKRNKLKF